MKDNRLKELRLKANKTQEDIANVLGISYQAYAHYEKCRRELSPEQLICLADYYGISVDYLLRHDEITPEERAAGATETRKISITPIEDEMLYLFREIGKKRGEDAQRALIAVAEKML